MHYHIILTERCNSQCKYCYEKSMKEFNNGLDKKWEFDFTAPADTNVQTPKLKSFIEKDPNPTLIFYGGEPLIQVEKIKEIIDTIPAEYRMQTNAKILDRLPIEYLNKIKKILVSFDGTKERTDHNRGPGTHDIVIKQLQKARDAGYNGEIVARMTLSFPDIFDQIKYLETLIEQNLFDSIHWQIDAAFYKFDFNEAKFTKFVSEYNEQITQLVNHWVDEMKNGKVLKFYPLLGLFDVIYHEKESKLACGAGYANYTISTDGKVVACPIMNNVKTFEAGDLNSDPKKLKQFDVIEPCTSCPYLKICGGRCLYSNHAKLWPPEGEKLVCDTIIHLIESIKQKLPEIKELINEGKISEKDFEFEKYFGPEIIP